MAHSCQNVPVIASKIISPKFYSVLDASHRPAVPHSDQPTLHKAKKVNLLGPELFFLILTHPVNKM